MGSRLLKKLTGAPASSAPAADGDDGDVAEGSNNAVATTAAGGKKRKATGPAQGDASAVKGEFSMTGFRISIAANLLL